MEITGLEYRPYRRPFRVPLETAHGRWSVREGFIVRLECSDGPVAYGEVAPIPAFGTETLPEAASFLDSIREHPERISDGLPGMFPCCAFALSSALRALERGASAGMVKSYPVAGLLPAGEAACARLTELAGAGFRTFKWKIGVRGAAAEGAVLEELLPLLPEDGKLRFDANGGLDAAGLDEWLALLAPFRDRVDFIEQPLPAGEETAMRRAAERSGIAIALDESLNGPDGRQWLRDGGWDGPLVVKPALMGDCRELACALEPVAPQVVVSSVFETAVGVGNVLALLGESALVNRAVGMNTFGYFSDGLSRLPEEPTLRPDAVSRSALSEVWNQLYYSN